MTQPGPDTDTVQGARNGDFEINNSFTINKSISLQVNSGHQKFIKEAVKEYKRQVVLFFCHNQVIILMILILFT